MWPTQNQSPYDLSSQSRMIPECRARITARCGPKANKKRKQLDFYVLPIPVPKDLEKSGVSESQLTAELFFISKLSGL